MFWTFKNIHMNVFECLCLFHGNSLITVQICRKWVGQEKKHKIFAHVQLLIIVVHFVVCLFVSLFSFFKSLKIALLENFSRFFWHLPADKQTRDFCLARSNVCAFIYLVELSVHCVLLFVGFWLACMVWAVSSPVALAGFFFFFF